MKTRRKDTEKYMLNEQFPILWNHTQHQSNTKWKGEEISLSYKALLYIGEYSFNIVFTRPNRNMKNIILGVVKLTRDMMNAT